MKAAIFDMDGLLVDSMIHWMEMDREFFNKRGKELTEEVITYLTGKSVKHNVAWLKEKFELEESVEELYKERKGWANKVYSEICQAMPGTDELLRKLKQKGLKQAVASGAPLHYVNMVVKRFGWAEHFDELFSVEDVEHRGKPEPDVFLLTAERLQIEPKDCVVFEDAENGVLSAKAAGMKCIAVPDERWSFGDFSKADLVADSLADQEIFKFLDL